MGDRDGAAVSRDLLYSAFDRGTARSLAAIHEWLKERSAANRFEVRKILLADMKGWEFAPDTGNLRHKSGKFFSIEGIEVNTNFGPTPRWSQPIINQPEIGILGFIVKRIEGTLRFLVQAKMEPGNVNLLQLSPTVQATRSNYTQVHGGMRPLYLDYFLDRGRARVLLDQLQSEQGSRFLRKRNRNVIVLLPDDEELHMHPDFTWMTLGEIFELLKVDNLVNMDSRTVLSGIRFTPHPGVTMDEASDFGKAVMRSAVADETESFHDLGELLSWLTQLKTEFVLETKRIPLRAVSGWETDAQTIHHRSGKFFSVVAVSVTATSREVSKWEQPLIESAKGGVLCFITQRKSGILHFLVQGRVEPGNFDAVEMAPTLQCTPSNYDRNAPELFPPFFELVMNAGREKMKYDSIQSEEGGRFYHDQNRYLIIEIDPATVLPIPANYIWMTMRQMKELIRFNNYFNIEARGLIACLGPYAELTER